MLLIPSVRDFVYVKSNIKISLVSRIFGVIVLIGISGYFLQEIENNNNIEYFNINREQILSSINDHLSKKNYHFVIQETNKYLASGNEEINN